MIPFFPRLAAAAFSIALCATAPAAFGQDGPIRLIVGASPGGTTDTVARNISRKMGEALKRTVVVENRAGAGGNIAAEYVAKSKADGSTLLVTFSSLSINASLYQNLPFDSVKDFTPISMLATVPSVLAVRKDFPANTLQELLALVKANPGKYSMAIGGVGSSLHMAGERMKMMANLNILNVPYKGTSPAITDLLGGQVDMMFASSVNVAPHVKAGTLKVLGVTSPKPLAQFPGVPPIGSAIPGFESNAWFALLGPAGLPPATLAALSAAARAAVAAPEFQEYMANDSASAVSSTPEELGAFIRKDIERYAELVKFSGAKPE